MTKYVRTASGSIYEIDIDDKRIRRLSGVADPTPRQGEDGQWKEYKNIMLVVNKQLLIVWETASNADGELICRTTATSSVEAFGDSMEAIVTIN